MSNYLFEDSIFWGASLVATISSKPGHPKTMVVAKKYWNLSPKMP